MPRDATQEAKAERRARLADHQRQQITSAAARCFAEAGYDATTMRAIAEACGFTASSLYTYFDGKEDIFSAIIEQLSEHANDVFTRPMPPSMGFEQRLELLFMRLLEFTETQRDALIFMKKMHHGCAAASAATDTMIRSEVEFIDAIRDWIASNAADQDFGDATLDDVAFFVWGTMHGFFVQWLARGDAAKLGNKLSVMTQLILKGLRP
ncbi:MAG: helix-turn-helix domain-containing protein [Deltaproteobacteria bacterium]